MYRVIISVLFLSLPRRLAWIIQETKTKIKPQSPQTPNTKQYLFHQWILLLKGWPQVTDVKFFRLAAIHNTWDIQLETTSQCWNKLDDLMPQDPCLPPITMYTIHLRNSWMCSPPKPWAGHSFFNETAIWRDPKGVAKEVKKHCKIV